MTRGIEGDMRLTEREYWGATVVAIWGVTCGRLLEYYSIGANPIEYPISTAIGLGVVTTMFVWMCFDLKRREAIRRKYEKENPETFY